MDQDKTVSAEAIRATMEQVGTEVDGMMELIPKYDKRYEMLQNVKMLYEYAIDGVLIG